MNSTPSASYSTKSSLSIGYIKSSAPGLSENKLRFPLFKTIYSYALYILYFTLFSFSFENLFMNSTKSISTNLYDPINISSSATKAKNMVSTIISIIDEKFLYQH